MLRRRLVASSVVGVAQEVEIRPAAGTLFVAQRGRADDGALAETLDELVERDLERAGPGARRDPLRLGAVLGAAELERGEPDEPDRRQRAERVEERPRGAMELDRKSVGDGKGRGR